MEKVEHTVWDAEKTAEGKVMINRKVPERDDLDKAGSEFLQEKVAGLWGLYGAALNDEFNTIAIPELVKSRFASTVDELKKANVPVPEIMPWEIVESFVGTDKVAELKEAISSGFEIRRLSKEMDLPFLATVDLYDDIEVIGKKAMKEIVGLIKMSKADKAINRFGKVAKKVIDIVGDLNKTASHKLAIDEAAKDYWEMYYGEYGKALVKEIKKRVRADFAYNWLIKVGVDEAAAAYWKNYFTEEGYGKALVKDNDKKREVPKGWAGKKANKIVLRDDPIGEFIVYDPALKKEIAVDRSDSLPSLANYMGWEEFNFDPRGNQLLEQIDAARNWLKEHVGESFEDPGYFDSEYEEIAWNEYHGVGAEDKVGKKAELEDMDEEEDDSDEDEFEKDAFVKRSNEEALSVLNELIGGLPPQFKQFAEKLFDDVLSAKLAENPEADIDDIMGWLEEELDKMLSGESVPEVEEVDEDDLLDMTDPGEVSDDEKVLMDKFSPKKHSKTATEEERMVPVYQAADIVMQAIDGAMNQLPPEVDAGEVVSVVRDLFDQYWVPKALL